MKRLLLGLILISAIPALGFAQKPVAADAQFSTSKNTTLQGNLSPLVSGGNPPYMFALQGAATNGTAFVSSNGAFTFVPNFNFTGSELFNYSVTDANGTSDEATVTVVIE